jgi:hypothetical protein
MNCSTYDGADNFLHAAIQLVTTINKECDEPAFLEILGRGRPSNSGYNGHCDLMGIVARPQESGDLLKGKRRCGLR